MIIVVAKVVVTAGWRLRQNNKVGVGGTCGGFMPYGMANTCEDGLECVNTMGPRIADLPEHVNNHVMVLEILTADVMKTRQRNHGIIS